MTEAFVYLWYDAPNKMYYLGKHKGSPDDTYTHSSSIWESFTKDNIPEGVTREILAYGTDEEMCILEHKLLVEAKNGGDWNRYYNESLGDPRYVDQWGENNPMYGSNRTGENNPNWKGGISLDLQEYDKKRNQTPERRALKKSYKQTPKYKAYRKAYDAERYTREQKDVINKKIREKRAKNKAETGFAMGYSQAKKKAESQGEGTLEPHMK